MGEKSNLHINNSSDLIEMFLKINRFDYIGISFCVEAPLEAELYRVESFFYISLT